MVSSVISFCLRFRPFVILVVLIVIIAGVYSYATLKKESYPDIGDTQVTVITKFPGKAAEEVEQLITLPLERSLNSVPFVLTRRSKSIFGLSVIQLVFADDTDDYFARERVLEKLKEVDLPSDVQPILAPLVGPVGEIIRYVIVSDSLHTPLELRTIQDWIVIPKILQVDGVADVINFGGLVKQFHVVTAPDQLVRLHLRVEDLIEAIRSNNVNTGGNIIERGEQGFQIRAVGAIQTAEDIENIVVSSQNGVPIFMKNIASVEVGYSPPTGILGYTSFDENNHAVTMESAVQGLVAMRRGGNPIDVGERVTAIIQEINSRYLPSGVKLKITYDRSDLANHTIQTVSRTLLEGVIIVTLVLLFFLGSIRAALIVASVIPIALLFAFTLMRFSHIPANLLSLGAIDFGIIVDGAVVMVEVILRSYSQLNGKEREEGIVKATENSAGAVGRELFFAIAIIILAYMPIFTFERVEGKLFSPMAYTLAFAILGSLILALTFVPILMSYSYAKFFQPIRFRNSKLEWENPVYIWILSIYRERVAWVLFNAKRVLFFAWGIVLSIFVLGLTFVGTEFLPSLDEGSLNIRCFFPVGISLDGANQYLPDIRSVIASHPEVNLVITQLGRNDDGTDPYGPNRLEILVGLKDYNDWKSGYTKRDLVTDLQSELESGFPSVNFIFSQPIIDNVTEAATGSVSDLAVMILGRDLKLMREKAEKILSAIRKIPGASEYGIEQEADQPQLLIRIDRQKAARYGINVNQVQEMIEAAIGGKPISTLFEENMRFGIVVRYNYRYRSSVQAIQDIQVTTMDGQRVPLRDLADISLTNGPTIIQRQDGNRLVSVRTNVRERDQGSFAAAVKKVVRESIILPKGYSISFGGQYENLQRAGKRLRFVIPLTVIMIFFVLFLLFRNMRLVFVAMACIPFSISGGILGLLLRGYNFNVSSGVGFISLFGISTMTGLLFVSRTRKVVYEDPSLSIRESILKSATIQLKPRLMTILLALLGLMPAALAKGIGSDIQRPLATVIVGGLTMELFFTLVLLPGIYLLFVSRKEKPES